VFRVFGSSIQIVFRFHSNPVLVLQTVVNFCMYYISIALEIWSQEVENRITDLTGRLFCRIDILKRKIYWNQQILETDTSASS
jgi:hypothetical protein